MPKGSSSGDFNRAMRKAQRHAETAGKKAQREAERRAETAAKKWQRDAEALAKRTNRDLATRMGRAIKDSNRDAERRARHLQDRAVSQPDHELLQDFQESLADQPAEASDLFLSYTRSDGWQVAGALYEGLRDHGVTVWFDERAMQLGHSQALQMDRGLTHAAGGLVLLTPAYLEGRFWPERELAALLHKPTVVPVLHNVTYGQVKAYSAILGDLHGLSTEDYTPAEIAELIADAVLDDAA